MSNSISIDILFRKINNRKSFLNFIYGSTIFLNNAKRPNFPIFYLHLW